MIPKTIHFFWLGSKKMPKLAIKCIDSWKKYCPDFEIKRWNEENYDFLKDDYMKQAFLAKKWGFATDYARLDVVYNYGGIYVDTDVEIIKPFTPLLNHRFFASLQAPGDVNTGQGFGAERNHPLLRELMDDYKNYSFLDKNGKHNLTTCPVIQTRFLTKEYHMISERMYPLVQNLKNGVTIYPYEYFDPMYRVGKERKCKIYLTPNTFSIHHYMQSWVPWREVQLVRIKYLLSLLTFHRL